MYLLIVLIPLLSAIVSGIFGRKIGSMGASVFTSSCISISALVTYYVLYETVLNGATTYLVLWRWIDSELVYINVGLQFDNLTITMLVLITSVSALVHIYSIGYMSDDPHIPRFMFYLSLFTFLMIVLVTSDNYIQLFIGWEGVGLCSYLLINFWITRIKANKAAIKAMLMNRVGDVGLVLAMIIILRDFGSLNFSSILGSLEVLELSNGEMTVISLLLFLGAVGKSAQLGLHTWLPDAMEGPTPVSALIHAATMVTAGVFLILRSGALIECSSLALIVITILGALTAFFAAVTGVVQSDLKRVVAYSTCSQLGYMVMVCGVSNYTVSLFHLLNHGFFKALLFLSAGSIIHALGNEQDMRKMGGLIARLPFVYTMTLIGCLSLMGFPYMAGFYSKDLILELMFDKYYILFAYWLGSVSAFLTAFYSIRLIFLTFIVNTNTRLENFYKVHEPSLSILFSLIVLAFGSVFLGFLAKDLILSSIKFPVISSYVKMIPLGLSLLGALVGYNLYKRVVIFKWVPKNRKIWQMWSGVYTFISSAWQFNYIINHFFVFYIWKFGYFVSYKIIDRGLLEIMGPKGLSREIINITGYLSAIQSGKIYNYVLMIIIFMVLFISKAFLP